MTQNTIFQAVIFDMDGVVINTRGPIEAFWHQWAEAYGISISRDVMEGKVHGCPARQTVEGLFSHLSQAEQVHLLEACETFENEMHYVPVGGIQPLLIQLKKAGVPVALVTSSLLPKVRKVQQALGLEESFITIVTADLVERGKPDPACYRLAAQKLSIPAAQCVAFEDAYSGVKAASGAGMFTVGVGPSEQEAILKEAGAQFLVPSFEDVKLQQGGDSGLLLRINEVIALPLVKTSVVTE